MSQRLEEVGVDTTKYSCGDCGLAWEWTWRDKNRTNKSECPNCRAELETEKAVNLGRAVNEQDRRIKFLERQVEAFEQRGTCAK